MRKFVILLLIISIISSSFLFVSASSDFGFIYLQSPHNTNVGSYRIDNFSSVQSVDIEFSFVYDESITFIQSQYVNQINITIWYDIDGTLIPERTFLRPNTYLYSNVNGVDPCFTVTLNDVIPDYNYYLNYFGYEDEFFNSVPAYHFRDVLTAFVETQNDPGVNYYRDYSYSDFAESGFVYYSHKYFPEDFSSRSLIFYQAYIGSYQSYNLFDEDGSALSPVYFYLQPGFNSISFKGNDLYNINYVRNTNLVFVQQINFSLLNNFDDPYVGVSFLFGSSTYIPFSDFVYNRFYPYYTVSDDIYKFFPDFFGYNTSETKEYPGGIKLYLHTDSDSSSPVLPPLSPEEQDKLEQDLKEKEDLEKAVLQTGWLDYTVQSTYRKEVLYNNAMNGLNSLNKPNFNTNDFTIDDSSKADLYNFAGLYAPVFNLDIVNSMLIFGFILAFVSYVLFGKKG